MATPKKQVAEDLDFQMSFYEAILRSNPEYVEALTALGEVYTKKGLYRKGLRVDKKLTRLRPNSPVAHYNLACSHSLLGDLDKSLESIEKAIRLGYDDVKFMCQDPDLSNLRKDSRFGELLEKIKQRQCPAAEGQNASERK